jgi:hypothetical protein
MVARNAGNTSGGVDERYIPVSGSAWHVSVADINGDGQKELVYGAYDGTVRCQSLSSGELLWEVDIEGFPFDLLVHRSGDDGSTTVCAASSGGKLFCIGSDGQVRWSFSSTRPLYNLVVGRFTGEAPLIACGGVQRSLFLLDFHGQVVYEREVSKLVHRLAAGDFDGDGRAELFLMDGKEDASILSFEAAGETGSGLQERMQWEGFIRLPEKYSKNNWEGKEGKYKPFDVIVGDVNDDGKDEIIMGDSYNNRQTVVVMSGAGDIVWASEPLEWFARESRWYEIFSTAFVAVSDYPQDIAGKKVIAVSGGNVRLFTAAGELVSEQESVLGFADVAIDGRWMYLGSTPNGDDTVYRVDLAGDWEEQVTTLERQGSAREVAENIEAVRRQALAHPGQAQSRHDDSYELQEYYFGPTKDRPNYKELLQQFGPGEGTVTHAEYQAYVAAFRAVTPYPKLWNVVSRRILEDKPVLRPDGEPLVSTHRYQLDSILGTQSPDQIVDMVAEFEQQRVPLSFEAGHNDNPFIHLETAERLLQVAPNYLVGFESVEDVSHVYAYDYVKNYLGPLCDLCLKYGGRTKVIIKNKNMWWLDALTLEQTYEELFKGRRGEVLVACTEESNTQLSEINFMTRMSLWRSGLVGHLRAHVHKDMFNWNRFHQWEYPYSGHPFLRTLIAQTVIGSSLFSVRLHHIRTDGPGPHDTYALTDVGREGAGTFYHLLGKGLVVPPRRAQLANIAPVGIIMHTPNQRWLNDAHNNHRPWTSYDDASTLGGVFPYLHCGWGNAPFPNYALSKVVFHKERCFDGLIPATPYGHVMMLPSKAPWQDVNEVDEWWHTDGISLWQGDEQRLTGSAAATALEQALERGTQKLPVRLEGDDVFYQVVKQDETSYRLYAIDPGWLDPRERNARFVIQLPGRFEVNDVLSGRSVPVQRNSFELTVPAGVFRVVEVRVT